MPHPVGKAALCCVWVRAMLNELIILGISVPWYGLFCCIGAAAAVAAALALCPSFGIRRVSLVGSAVPLAAGALIGSKLLYILVSWRDIAAGAISPSALLTGGFVFFGGLLGGAVGLAVYARTQRLPLRPYLDLYAVVLPLGHALGRVGCFFAGCCYGVPCDFGIAYRHSVNALTPIGIKLFPVQLAEACGLLLLFGVQLMLLRKRRFSGQCAVCYGMAYPTLRFILEFFRGDAERGGLFFLSTSQWICLLVIGGAVAAQICIQKKKRSLPPDAGNNTPP